MMDRQLDDVDQYMLATESHRIRLVAKLKTVFDRFDTERTGRLAASAVEQALVYMERPIEAEGASRWLSRLHEARELVDFAEFVSAYSAIFAGSDPDLVGDRRQKERSGSPSRKCDLDHAAAGDGGPANEPKRQWQWQRQRQRESELERERREDETEFDYARRLRALREGGHGVPANSLSPDDESLDIRLLAELKVCRLTCLLLLPSSSSSSLLQPLLIVFPPLFLFSPPRPHSTGSPPLGSLLHLRCYKRCWRRV